MHDAHHQPRHPLHLRQNLGGEDVTRPGRDPDEDLVFQTEHKLRLAGGGDIRMLMGKGGVRVDHDVQVPDLEAEDAGNEEGEPDHKKPVPENALDVVAEHG